MIPSEFQQAIFDAVKNTDDSLLVKAVAGSGKTTTIVKAVDYLPKNIRTIFVAFNKSIATELSRRLPSHVASSTLHSVGLKAIRNHFGNVKVDSNKVYTIMDNDPALQKLMTQEFTRTIRYSIKVLVGLLKNNGVVPESVKGPYVGLMTCSDADIRTLMSHYDINFNLSNKGLTAVEFRQIKKEFDEKLFKVVRRILELNIKMDDVVDFDDMLYFPAITQGIRFPKFHVVIVDEAQDVSGIQRVLLRNILREGGRIIAVGDDSQAIYGFRGADSESLNSIQRDFGAVEYPLSICYRCPTAVIDEAKSYVEDIQPSPTAEEGRVGDIGPYKPETMDGFEQNDYVLCRNTAPLIKCAFALIKVKKPCAVKGEDLGKSIKTLITSLKATCLPELKSKIREWEQTQKQKRLADDPDANVTYIEDRAETVRVFIDCCGGNTVNEVLDSVDSLFSDKAKGVITLSTIHKSKGLEANRVLLLDRHLMPSKYAKLDWQKRQEDNLMYVAITRAMKELIYVYTPK